MSPAFERRAVAAAVGAAAGVAALGGSLLLTGGTPAFLGAAVAGALTTAAPGTLVALAIALLGDAGQPLLFVAALALAVGVVAIAAAGCRRLAAATGELWVAPPALGVVVAAATLGLSGSAASALGAGGGAALVLGVATVRVDAPVSAARRRVLHAGAVAGVLGAAGVVGRLASGNAADPRDDVAVDETVRTLLETARERSLDVDGLEPLVSEEFYQVDINSVDPRDDPETWSLRVTGAVETPREVDLTDLTDRPAVHRFVTLRCVGDALNGHKMDTALWTGVPVTDLFADGELPDECCVMLRAADDYYEEFPLSALDDALLAYRMNGRPLPRGHGAPVRALVPGHWGEINVKWLTEIEVLDRPATGYWEQRGWHGTGPVVPVAKLHDVTRLDGGRVRLGGHAYAGTRGVSRVEVSTDGGETWVDATLSDPLPGATAADGTALAEAATDAWRMWTHEYEAAASHEAVVRVVDGRGEIQSRERRDPYPRGASGWVRERVRL